MQCNEAAQLMPPPRLPGHLRPCHPSGTAYQVRCAHRRTYAQSSTVGDESPQTTTTNSHDTERKSWWTSALSRITPWDSQTSSAEPRPDSQPQPQDTPTSYSSEAKKDLSEEQTSEIGAGQIARIVESPAERQRRILRSEARTHGKQADNTESRDQDFLPVRTSNTPPEKSSDQPVVLRKVSSFPDTHKKSENTREQQPTIQKVQRKQPPIAISEEDVATSPQTNDIAIIRQQIQGLFEQVKALEAALEAKTVVDRQPSSTRQENHTSSTEHAPLEGNEQQSVSTQSLSTRRPLAMGGDSSRHAHTGTRSSRSRSDTLPHSLRAWRHSVVTLGKTATRLEAMRSPAVAPVARHVRNRLRVLDEVAKLENDLKLRTLLRSCYRNWDLVHAEGAEPNRDHTETTLRAQSSIVSNNLEEKSDSERLTRRLHTQPRSMKSSNPINTTTEDSIRKSTVFQETLGTEDKVPPDSRLRLERSTTTTDDVPSKPTPDTSGLSEQSLLEELFPETSSTSQPQSEPRDRYPKLHLPDSTPVVRRENSNHTQSFKERVVESLHKQGEQVTVLQLTNCSTELTEADFRRIIPKGKHIEGWHRDDDLYKVVPGRDPLSLERLPFYYLLFKSAEAALAYQKNASRLHKLSALHQPANIFSAIPPPKGFIEEGEDITAAISSYNLLPTRHPMSLNVLMQPYNPALRNLVERGGYQPIAPSVDAKGNPIWRVLMHIEGYEPTPSDLFKIFSRDAYKHGMILPLRNESQTSIHRLRDMINLKVSSKAVSSSRPRAYGTFDQSSSDSEMTYDDPAIQSMLGGVDEDSPSQQNQLVMNRVYNRWVLDFDDEDTARRWSVRWHRRLLPELSHTKGAWRDSEEARICNTELLW